MEITVTKLIEQKDRTISVLAINGVPFCFTLEDGYNEVKIPGETRIPGGRYEVVKRTVGEFFEKYKQKFGHRYSLQVKDVPGFENILIHIGNFIKDTRGCILVGTYIDMNSEKTGPGKLCLADSTTMYKRLYSNIDAAFYRGDKVFITINR